MAIPAKISIRKGRLQDLGQLTELENLCFSGDRLTRARFRHWLQAENGILMVAEDASRSVVAGYALAFTRRDSRFARLYSIAIHKHYRGLGLGRKLLQTAERAAAKQGCSGLRLEVAVDNTPARQLYESMGYTCFRTIPGYYEDGGTAARMQKRFER
jgi:ribosomal protein S18 acetylase RimI-like enzyme